MIKGKVRLLQRVRDIAFGATGGEFHDSNEVFCPDDLCRFILALQAAFQVDTESKKNGYLFKVHNIDEYETIETTTDFLWDHKVRA